MAFAIQAKVFLASPKNMISNGSDTVGKGWNKEGHRQEQPVINNSLQQS